ncbi:MAG TPA: response regulator [Burkholderiaceae bacterium]|nr:response regulator [Burkholderiaceae bacterium]
MSSSVSVPTSGRTALVVDDDAFTCSCLTELLADLGFSRVETASNGRQALKLLRQFAATPDVLICDIYMPDMDGIEFLEQLIERRYTGRLMLVSGMDVQTLTLAREIADAGPMKFLGAFLKPLSRETLVQALGSI